MKNRNTIFTVFLALAFLVISSIAHAVNPAPDGGYPGENTAEGDAALDSLTTGTFNTSVGFFSQLFNMSGSGNTSVGAEALDCNQDGSGNTATGAFALIGGSCPYSVNYNTADGYFALSGITSGSSNTAVGYYAGTAVSSGFNNTLLGRLAGSAISTAANTICIGANVAGENVSGCCYIGGIYGRAASGGLPVYVNFQNKLGTLTSSRRFKEHIQSMDRSSETLFSLRPVTFHYKKDIDPSSIDQFGLLAEDVEKVNPNLIVRDQEGKPYSVRYDQVNAMLLNEFLKEHRKVQQVEKGIATLTAQLKEQATQIQKVTAKMEINKPPSKVVLNNQ